MDSIYELPGVTKEAEEEDNVRYHTRSNYSNLPAAATVSPSLKKVSDHVSSIKQTGGTSSRTYKRETVQVSKKKQQINWKWITAAAISFLILVIVVVVIVIAVKVYQPSASGQTGTNQTLYPEVDFPKNCLDLREHGEMESGFYVIQPEKKESPFTAYCDMGTSGGGWTLVASVHENDVSGKCTTGDMWFSDDKEDTSLLVSRNWENNNTFGIAKQATSNDYKNAGYSSIKASDILIRHTPNNAELSTSKQKALLEYHTETGFLKNHSGNLYGIYSKEYDLASISADEIFYTENNDKMLDALGSIGNDIINGIPSFYRYVYDSSLSSYFLNDGGNNMFTSYGMRVYASYCGSSYLVYGQNYTCSNTAVVVASRRSMPFFALMTIGNNNVLNKRSSFSLRVQSYRPPDETLQPTFTGILNRGNFTMQYNADCRYQPSTTVPSLCDVFYAVSNVQLWKSSSFSFTSSRNDYSTYYYLYQYVQSYPENIVLGYTMLSRTNGLSFSEGYVTSALSKMLDVFSTFLSVGKSCEDYKPGLVEPVKYTIGGTSVLGTIPTSLREDVATGYLQFRARNNYGAALALCPAIRTETCEVDSLCVGGVFKEGSSTTYCSDYANWNYGNNIEDLDEFTPGSISRSRQLIESTVLIFYR